jgi:hypothetical protein
MRFIIIAVTFVGCGGSQQTPDAHEDDAPMVDAPICKPDTTLFLARGGGTYTAGTVNDSRTNQLDFATIGATIAPYDKPSWPDALACIHSRLQPFSIAVSEIDPGTADHLEIVLSPGDSTELGLPANIVSITDQPGGCTPFANRIGVVWPSTVADDATNTCELVVQIVGVLASARYTTACDDAMAFGVAQTNCGGPFVNELRPCQAGSCCDNSPMQNSFSLMAKAYGVPCS